MCILGRKYHKSSARVAGRCKKGMAVLLIELILILAGILMTIAGLLQPWPKWVFWAVCLLLIGFICPPVWLGLGICLLVRGLGALARITRL